MNQIECMIGVDVGGTNTRIGLVDRSGRLMAFDIISTASLQEEGNFCRRFREALTAYIKRNQGAGKICGVSLGFPSTVDKDRRRLLSTPNIRNMDNVPIVDEIASAIPLPVFLEKDVNMLISHDINYFHIDENCSVIACYIGTGLGNAVYFNGGILRGKNGVAGELGHIPVMNKNDLCGCGNEGCMENYASGRYLENLCRNLFPDVPIDQVFERYGSHPEILRFIEYLSIPVATEINIFDPDYVILGGGILQMKNFPQLLLEKEIYTHPRKPFPAGNLNILYSPTAQENGVIGAAIYGFRQLGRRRQNVTKLGPRMMRTV